MEFNIFVIDQLLPQENWGEVSGTTNPGVAGITSCLEVQYRPMMRIRVQKNGSRLQPPDYSEIFWVKPLWHPSSESFVPFSYKVTNLTSS